MHPVLVSIPPSFSTLAGLSGPPTDSCEVLSGKMRDVQKANIRWGFTAFNFFCLYCELSKRDTSGNPPLLACFIFYYFVAVHPLLLEHMKLPLQNSLYGNPYKSIKKSAEMCLFKLLKSSTVLQKSCIAL